MPEMQSLARSVRRDFRVLQVFAIAAVLVPTGTHFAFLVTQCQSRCVGIDRALLYGSPVLWIAWICFVLGAARLLQFYSGSAWNNPQQNASHSQSQAVHAFLRGLEEVTAEEWASIGKTFPRQRTRPVPGVIIASVLYSQALRHSHQRDAELEHLVFMLRAGKTESLLQETAKTAAICALLALRMRGSLSDWVFALLYFPFEKYLPAGKHKHS
jgi:hypothetical protein